MVYLRFLFKLFKSDLRRTLDGVVVDTGGYFITKLVEKQPQVLTRLGVGVRERERRDDVSAALGSAHNAVKRVNRIAACKMVTVLAL